jgi:cytochrome c-type biogenesis protein CcmE
MKPKHRRFWYLSLIAFFLGGATLVVLTSLNDHLLFFMMPSDVVAKNPKTTIRLGGLVVAGSLNRQDLLITFKVTDDKHTIPVAYKGIAPDLFREGQGVVAQGVWVNGVFQATHLLAKHDENYMPKEIAEKLKENGRWRPAENRS